MKKIVSILVVAGLAMGAQAGIWDETTNGGGDAGDLAGTAQMTSGTGGLTGITGNNAASDVDLYIIKIVDPGAFRATVLSGPDSQLWLFNLNGGGIVHNDDSTSLFSQFRGVDVFTTGSTTGMTVASQLVAGECYILGYSRYNRDALNGANTAMFAGSPFNGIHGLIAGSGPLASWTGTTSAGGAYSIELVGADYCIPTPGTAALLGLGGLLAARRRR